MANAGTDLPLVKAKEYVFLKENRFLFVRVLSALSLVAAIALLASNLPFIPARTHAWISAVPLALAGIGYAFLQLHLHPERRTLLKRLLLAFSFVLWAVVQLLEPGRIATLLGDVVIAAYVLDLSWMVNEQVAEDK